MSRSKKKISQQKKNIPPLKEEVLPLKEESLPSKEESLPLKKEVLPLKEEVLPLKKEVLPLKEESLPLKEEVAPLKKEEPAPLKEEPLPLRKKMRIAMPAWEIGRVETGLGVKIGGLGVVMEELPQELVKAAARQDIDLEVEILSPCFAHYDKSKLTKLDLRIPVTLDNNTFAFDVYEYTFPDGQKAIYFWDWGQLNWTTSTAVYPSDPQLAMRLYATVAQAMAGYIKQKNFDTVHLHDYHVGLVPVYLGDDYLANVPAHFTIHNASYQGNAPIIGTGQVALDRLNLPGQQLFPKYFEFFGNLNIMKACMLKLYEADGKITTVSGDLEASWGYAAELKESSESIRARAQTQKGSPPGGIFHPNRALNLFEKLPIIGITNGMSERNRPENLAELKTEVLQKVQAKRGANKPIFSNPITQQEMLAHDHNFEVNSLNVKAELHRLLHLETFGHEPSNNPILITAVGRLVEQKNLGLVCDVVERVLNHDANTKFIILASAPDGEKEGKASEADFFRLASWYQDRVYFNNTFNSPLAKLILAGGDFTLIPSRFEPCGLVDYEASLVGTVVIGRAIGGLTKVRHCGYLYEWLDISDRAGEANAFFNQIKSAIDNYRHNYEHHTYLMRTAMAIDASWDKSTAQYIDMYRYGLQVKDWRRECQNFIPNFVKSLGADKSIFNRFFVHAEEEPGNDWDKRLKTALNE